jgi:hypothetical protein
MRALSADSSLSLFANVPECNVTFCFLRAAVSTHSLSSQYGPGTSVSGAIDVDSRLYPGIGSSHTNPSLSGGSAVNDLMAIGTHLVFTLCLFLSCSYLATMFQLMEYRYFMTKYQPKVAAY